MSLKYNMVPIWSVRLSDEQGGEDERGGCKVREVDGKNVTRRTAKSVVDGP
jgi:hypothetical protein